ncbi:Shedu anti-phage system protein SduA domain-containing protein [uncultured Cellulomonas sp.]|uniref:Shedu anti-phage system protein SduA domain-containing protein n=1 Tax=uncultured Cellulomonas sp. TaxID=189682 RepID=UPI00261F6969|nr:Shedu anti-phage system protein SduA domain-containing protein [uncultured Cellulomonas sp.]
MDQGDRELGDLFDPFDEDFERGPQDDVEDDVEDDDPLRDRSGSVEESNEGSELVLSWKWRGDRDATEMLRFDRATEILRIFPMIHRNMNYENPFSRLTELQIEAPRWNSRLHSNVSDRYGLLHVVGLPKGFSAIYQYGLGVSRDYRGLLDELEKHTGCNTVRFIRSGDESVDGAIFRLSLDRFATYKAVVDRNRRRGATAVRRVIDAESHNAVAELFRREAVEPKYGRNAVINAITEEVASGYVTTASDRDNLVQHVILAAPKVAHEAPQQFGRLRDDIELVSLEVLIEQFEKGLSGRAARSEDHWQKFFATNTFALQQVFSAPILVVAGQVHVRGTDALGQGSRIADFLCVNAVTRSAVVVEIKTPASRLIAAKGYRGSGSAEVYPTHRDLSGAVSQLQAQIESVPRDLRMNPALGAVDQWHVRGAVITGRVSELNDEQRASFLRYREGLTAVTVLGYDEVGERLKYLHAMLKASPS